jgi:hypothetical protein
MIEKGSEIGILSLQLIKKIHGSGRVGSGGVGCQHWQSDYERGGKGTDFYGCILGAALYQA